MPGVGPGTHGVGSSSRTETGHGPSPSQRQLHAASAAPAAPSLRLYRSRDAVAPRFSFTPFRRTSSSQHRFDNRRPANRFESPIPVNRNALRRSPIYQQSGRSPHQLQIARTAVSQLCSRIGQNLQIPLYRRIGQNHRFPRFTPESRKPPIPSFTAKSPEATESPLLRKSERPSAVSDLPANRSIPR